MPQYFYEIGTMGTGTINLESLSTACPPPKSAFRPYARLVDAADGSRRGVGYPTAEWRWGYLDQVQRDQLRVFCTGASTSVYIRTRTMDNADSYKYYSGVVVWPVESEERDAGRRPDFVLAFRKLIEYTP